MPQLDLSSYISQIFWLIVSFSLIYAITRAYIFPKINAMVLLRQNIISKHLDAASEMQSKAEELQARYQQEEAAIKQKLDDMMAKALIDLEQYSKKGFEELDKKLLTLAKEAEGEIQIIKENFNKSLEVAIYDYSKFLITKATGLEVSKEEVNRHLKHINR